MKHGLSLFVLCCCLLVSGCSETDTPEILEFDEYSSLFEEAATELEISNYVLVGDTLGEDVTVIDAPLSFNTRTTLTIDDKSDLGNLKSTQETLFYLSKDKSRAIMITFAYTDTFIGNDVISYPMTSDYGLPETLTQTNELLTLSYQNLVITVLQTAEDSVDGKELNEAALEIVEFLEGR